MILASALALLLPSASDPMVVTCKVKTFQDTDLSIVIDSTEIIDRRGSNWVNKETGKVRIAASNDGFLSGNADLMEFDAQDQSPRRLVVRVVRDGPPPSGLIVVDLQISKLETAGSFEIGLVQWGLHGERMERGSGTCSLQEDEAA